MICPTIFFYFMPLSDFLCSILMAAGVVAFIFPSLVPVFRVESGVGTWIVNLLHLHVLGQGKAHTCSLCICVSIGNWMVVGMREQSMKCLHESDKKSYSIAYHDMSARQHMSKTENNWEATCGIIVIGELNTTLCKAIIKIFLFMKCMCNFRFEFWSIFGKIFQQMD